jgi:hypothetical protein
MDIQTNDRKAKTHKGKLHLNSLLPKEIEDAKQSVIINTANSSQILRMLLSDIVNTIYY